MQKADGSMKRRWGVVLPVFLAAVVFWGSVSAEERVAVVGTVTDTNQVVDEAGQIYEVADTEAGYQLIENVGKKVKVTAVVEEDDGRKVLVVEAFELLGD
jgi:hypothetical protein